MGRRGEHRFHTSAPGTVYKKRGHDCAGIGIEKSFSKRTSVRDADADLLHQSSGKRTQRHTPRGIAESEDNPFSSNRTKEESE
jgi:hypothetical protein